MDWGWLNLFARAIASCSFAKVVIVSSPAGVRFIDCAVGQECLVGDGRGILVMGSPGASCDRCCSFAKVAVMSSEIGRRSRCIDDDVCDVNEFAFSYTRRSIADGL